MKIMMLQRVRNLAIFFILLTLGLTFNVTTSMAQGQAGLAFSAGVPQNEFDRSIKSNGFGVNGNVGLMIAPPVMLGLELGYLIYGSETRNVPFSLTIPDVTVDVSTTNNIFQSHMLLRVQAPAGPVRPYVDGLFGFNYLFTETSIRDEDDLFHGDDDEIASTTNYDDFALSYGIGGGALVQVYRSNKNRVFLDFRMRYLKGSRATYLREGGIARENGTVTLSPVESRTDLLSFNVGVAVTF